MANPNEHSVHGLDHFFLGLEVLEPNSGNFSFFRVQDFLHDGIPDEFDFLVSEQPVLHNFGGAQLLAAVDNVDLGGVTGQEQSVFRRGVAPADHHDFPPPEEVPIAGGAGGNPVPKQSALGFQSQKVGRSP